MKKILERDQPDGYQSFKYSNGWFTNWKRRFKVVQRKRTNKKTIPLEVREPLLKRFHILLHGKRNTDVYVHQSEIFGRFAASNTYTFDEIPFPFALKQDTTYDAKGASRVYVKQCGNGKCSIFIFCTKTFCSH